MAKLRRIALRALLASSVVLVAYIIVFQTPANQDATTSRLERLMYGETP